ncbi:MAG: hypothetical protein U0166_16420 [Acidobacteriota bacterium]
MPCANPGACQCDRGPSELFRLRKRGARGQEHRQIRERHALARRIAELAVDRERLAHQRLALRVAVARAQRSQDAQSSCLAATIGELAIDGERLDEVLLPALRHPLGAEDRSQGDRGAGCKDGTIGKPPRLGERLLDDLARRDALAQEPQCAELAPSGRALSVVRVSTSAR